MIWICSAQAQTWDWNRHIISPYAFVARNMKVSKDKHIYLHGAMVWNAEIGFYPNYVKDQCYQKHDADGYVVKMDTLGNVVWKNKYGGVYTNPVDMDIDSDNNVLVAGYITKPTTYPESDTIRYTADKYEVKEKVSASILVKYDKAGNYAWSKLFEADNYFFATIRALRFDKNDNFYVAGTYGQKMYMDDTTVVDSYNDYSGEIMNYSNGFIVKYDKQGKRKFFKNIQGGAFSSVIAREIRTDSFGNLYWTGIVSGPVKFDDNHRYDYGRNASTTFIVKFNPEGNVIWVYEIPRDQNSNFIEAVTIDEQNNIYIGGSFHGSWTIGGVTNESKPGSGGEDCFIIKLNQNGKFIWFKQFGSAVVPAPGKAADPETVSDFYINSDGFLYVTGRLGQGAKIDGLEAPPINSYLSDIFLAKMDSSGSTQWVKKYGTYYSDLNGLVDGWGEKVISGALINSDGGFVTYEDGIIIPDDCSYYAGYYRLLNDCNATLKFSNGTLTASTGESYKWFFNGTEISSATEQTFVPDVVGDYKVEVTFSETCKSLSVPVTVSVTSVKGQSKYSSVSLYPNPANNEVYVEGYSGFSSDVSECRIYNSSGILMKESKLEMAGGNYKGRINVSDLQTGLYMLEILTEAGSINKKFVKN